MVPTTPTHRSADTLDSDRESLPFPRGGVHGPADEDASPVEAIEEELTLRIADIQGRLDALRDEFEDEPIRLESGDWPPAAA